MTRGQAAPLSTNEEITLRRVAYGQSDIANLRAQDLARLRALDLIKGSAHVPTLTSEGQRRFDGLPKAAMANALAPQNELMAVLGRLMARKPGR